MNVKTWEYQSEYNCGVFELITSVLLVDFLKSFWVFRFCYYAFDLGKLN